VNWDILDAHQEAAEAKTAGAYAYYVSSPYTSDFFSDASFCPRGVVRVGTGAMLDLSAVKTTCQEVSGLEVDCASGAGTITTFRPAANGVLSLVGGASVVFDGAKYLLPITVGSVLDAERLSAWTVKLDGKTMTDWRLMVDDQGRLFVKRKLGFVLIFK